MDLTAARAELQERGYSYLSTARLDIMLNNAKNAFEEHWPWSWLQTTTTGTAPLTITDLRQVLYVIDTTDQRQLVGLDAASVADIDTNVSRAGLPWVWWLDGTTLKVYPTSSAALSVRYVKVSPELSAGSDIPLIPVRHHQIWLDLAVVEAAKDDNDFQGAQTILQDALRRLDRLIEVYTPGLDRQALSLTALDW